MRLVARLIRLVALVASLIIVVSFSFFAVDLASEASALQRERISESLRTAPGTTDEGARERRNSVFREAVDDANDFLLSPFARLVEGQDIWVQRIATGLLGLLVYGLALSLLANFIRK